uniref:EOG090X0DP2 n=1 Tax=Daphnia dolichocephala TaxID=2282166 RepID=A0A4Y7M2F7_9CRUS|nr:EOG090X0DP2 [Daphnia dolichocephala]
MPVKVHPFQFLFVASPLLADKFIGVSDLLKVRKENSLHRQFFIVILNRLVCFTSGIILVEAGLGYRKVFEQYGAILQQKYPSLAIEGENHPPPFLNQKIAQFLGIVKILLILLVISGTNVFGHLGVQTPSVWEWTQQNKFYACLMTFFLCNAIEGQLISTGAFEITLNDVPLWSKLETGRIPQPPELFQMIDNHLSMASPQLSLDS